MVAKILLTGATGFLGSRLAKVLNSKPDVNLVVSSRTPFILPGTVSHRILSIDGNTNWSNVISDREFVIHVASRAHINKDDVTDPLMEYRRVNVDGTLQLARHSARAGVKRFIFISSIGVNGNINSRPFTENDTPNPAEPYALSKLEAEEGLWDIHKNTSMEIVIIRPPLIYGANAPGNFGKLVSWLNKGFPLPLGSVNNKRSLVSLDNLVDLIFTCIEHPAAANQLFLAGDGQDVSTRDLLMGVAKVMGKPLRLVPLPTFILMLAGTLLGKKAMALGLLGSLQVDISKARNLLGWEPPISVEEGLRRCFVED